MSPVINKFLIALVTFIAALSIVLSTTPEVAPTIPEYLMLITTFLGALGVYAIPNAPRTLP